MKDDTDLDYLQQKWKTDTKKIILIQWPIFIILGFVLSLCMISIAVWWGEEPIINKYMLSFILSLILPIPLLKGLIRPKPTQHHADMNKLYHEKSKRRGRSESADREPSFRNDIK